MTFEAIFSASNTELLYRAFFDALPGNSILVKADAPMFTIAAATPEYLTNSGYAHKTLIGKGVFEAFPVNDKDPAHKGDRDLFASFQYVLQQKKPHDLPLQRYDLQADDGSFIEKHWKVSNKPVFSPEGEIIYIIHTAEDITERVKAAEMKKQMQGLEESEQDLHRLILQAPIGICVMDAATLVSQIANETFVEIAGKPLEEIVGWMYWDTFSEARPYYEDALNKVVQQGITFRADEVEVPLIRHGKREVVHVTFVYEPLKDSFGAVKKVVVWVLDNTPQVVARRKVEESETKFRLMAESTPVLIAVGDETGNIVYYNKAWKNLTGRTIEDLLRSNWADIIYPEDRERFVTIFQNAFAVKEPFAGEFRVQNATGECRWLMADGVPRFDTAGNFAGYIAACTDITEHKETENKLQTALEQMRLSKEAAELGTFDMDLEKGTLDWDDRCRILFGISHHNPVTYEKDFAGGLHPGDRERILHVIERLFIKSISNGDYDVEYRTVGAEDGVLRWVRAKGKVYFNEQEKPFRFIGSVLDITEQKTALQKIESIVEERTKELALANDALLMMNRELQRSNAHLEEFAHAASHDLKEPIRKIHFFTNQLKQQFTTQLQEAELRAFNRIENASQRMSSLIDDLLLYSHVSQKPHEKESVDLNESLQRVLEDLELDIKETDGVITPDTLPVVKGYKRQLQQMFQNLVSNALKYSKDNVPPRINIRATTASENNITYHVITVEDNGIGFDQEHAGKIFQMFTRLHGKAEYSGTGVGLSIVKKVVENHNGFIKVESALGEGSSFKIFLPV